MQEGVSTETGFEVWGLPMDGRIRGEKLSYVSLIGLKRARDGKWAANRSWMEHDVIAKSFTWTGFAELFTYALPILRLLP